MTTMYLDLDAYSQEMDDLARDTGGTVRVLDVGCGRGDYHDDLEQYLEKQLCKRRGEQVDVDILGMDVDRESLEGLEQGIVYDAAEEFPFRDGSMDIVISNKLMPNIDRDGKENVLSESRRVLKEHGFMTHQSYPVP